MRWSSALVFFMMFLGACAFVVFLILGGFGKGMLGRHDAIVGQRPAKNLQAAVRELGQGDRDRLDGLEFALRLGRAATVGEAGKNGCVSPYSVQVPLLMILNGAQSETFETVAKVLLSRDPTAEKYNDAHSKLIDILTSEPDDSVRVATAMWSVQPVRFKKQFADDMARYYDAEVRKIGSAGSGALRQVNDWVKERSQGRVTKLFDRLSPQSVVVIVSVITLDADWEEPFASTRLEPFETPRGRRTVPTLVDGNRSYRYVKSDGLEAATLAYTGSTLEATFVLPDKDSPPAGSAAFWDGLTSARLTKLLKGRREVEGRFQVPKFAFSDSTDLVKPLTRLGGGSLFRKGNDFSLLMHDSEFDFISQFMQKAVIEVDEKGTRAAAATGVDAAKGAEPGHTTDFVADRPFLFLVRESASGAVLFLAVVNDPSP